ncbi:MAG: proteasome accessory factor PafA2 family protein [Armatimonadetes bacterium]|nr:proteasome accessory factor PafA2 family protein [Armatimonadota bacterium]
MKLSDILAGTETEYGLLVEGRDPTHQVQDSMEFVQSSPGPFFAGWDYRYESPRQDLRGFKLDHLAVDPEDWKFESDSKLAQTDANVRADRVLANGARFYNDHGHPEYSTPECFGLRELAYWDRHGQDHVWQTAIAYREHTDRNVRVFKNNTDFHGAAYGTHESYLCSRSLGFERLYASVLPILIARQLISGAGKVGAENKTWVDFQMSQRADFFAEAANAETLYRRPIFNTRDEPHANISEFIRLHVISGDANMMMSNTYIRVGLVKIAVALAELGVAPAWAISDPVRSFQNVSRDLSGNGRIELDRGSHTTALHILDDYLTSYARHCPEDDEFLVLERLCRRRMEAIATQSEDPTRLIDWAAKKYVIEELGEVQSFRDPMAQSLDLAYCDLDPDSGLFEGLLEEELVDDPLQNDTEPTQDSRALPRAIAVSKFSDDILACCWRSIVFRVNGEPREVTLEPNRRYSQSLWQLSTVESFIRALESETPS